MLPQDKDPGSENEYQSKAQWIDDVIEKSPPWNIKWKYQEVANKSGHRWHEHDKECIINSVFLHLSGGNLNFWHELQSRAFEGYYAGEDNAEAQHILDWK